MKNTALERTWPYNLQNTFGPQRNQGRQAKNPRKEGCWTKKCLKNIAVVLKCQSGVVEWACWRPAKSGGWRATHALSQASMWWLPPEREPVRGGAWWLSSERESAHGGAW